MDCITNYIPQHEDDPRRPLLKLVTPYAAGDKVVITPSERGRLGDPVLIAALEHQDLLTVIECNPHYAMVTTRFCDYPVTIGVQQIMPVPDNHGEMYLINANLLTAALAHTVARIERTPLIPIALDRRLLYTTGLLHQILSVRHADVAFTTEYVLLLDDGSLVNADYQTVVLADSDMLYKPAALDDVSRAKWRDVCFAFQILDCEAIK